MKEETNYIIEELEKNFLELRNFFRAFGDQSTKQAVPIIQDILQFLNCEKESGNNNISFIKNRVSRKYYSLFQAKNPISEFYVWDDDVEIRRKLNEPMRISRNEIENLLRD